MKNKSAVKPQRLLSPPGYPRPFPKHGALASQPAPRRQVARSAPADKLNLVGRSLLKAPSAAAFSRLFCTLIAQGARVLRSADNTAVIRSSFRTLLKYNDGWARDLPQR